MMIFEKREFLYSFLNNFHNECYVESTYMNCMRIFFKVICLKSRLRECLYINYMHSLNTIFLW